MEQNADESLGGRFLPVTSEEMDARGADENSGGRFLPVTAEEMDARGWEAADFVIVTGDPYVDHPSFGVALIGRWLMHLGYKTAVLPQPEWRTPGAFRRLRRPRLAFLVTGGSLDSMVANYTASKRPRRKDSLGPGGRPGARPDRALITYAGRCKEAYKDVPVILGGLEASLRRLSHYDYWSDTVRRSVLMDATADILVYGMGDLAIAEIAAALSDGFEARDITWVRGTVTRARGSLPEDGIRLPSFEETRQDPDAYCLSFALQSDQQNHFTGKPLTEFYPTNHPSHPPAVPPSDSTPAGAPAVPPSGQAFASAPDASHPPAGAPSDSNPAGAPAVRQGVTLVQQPPQPPLTTEELDQIYELPFLYDQHPIYRNGQDEIPALHEIRFSIAHVRGCYGNCAFCAITHHQGRVPTARSKASVLREARLMTAHPAFKGYIHDVGGPTANIRGPACDRQLRNGPCRRKDCLHPEPCKKLQTSHEELIMMLRELSRLPGIKKIFIRSGIRHDLVLADGAWGQTFIRELAAHHVSGLLKTAPEHVSEPALSVMRKPPFSIHEEFQRRFHEADPAGRQYIIPYFISAHPGCRLEDAFAMPKYGRQGGFIPDQIQDFYPTPGSLATCIYHTGKDPFTGTPVHVPGRCDSIPDERQLQRALIHFRKPENRAYVEKALRLIGKEGELDLPCGSEDRRRPTAAPVKKIKNTKGRKRK
jgi:radical SAM superfamily enzyme YgiQ (UPF0313 family)